MPEMADKFSRKRLVPYLIDTILTDDNSFYMSRDRVTENWQGKKIEITVGREDDCATKEQQLGDERMNDRNTMKYKMKIPKRNKN